MKPSEILLRAAEIVCEDHVFGGCHAIIIAGRRDTSSASSAKRYFNMLSPNDGLSDYGRFWFGAITFAEAISKGESLIDNTMYRSIALSLAAAIAESEGD